MHFYNDLDLNNQKILCLLSIFQFERKLGFWTTLMHMYLRKNKYAFYNENQIRTRTHLCINFCSNLLKYVHILDMTLCIQMRSVGQCSVHSCSLSLIKQMLVCTGNAKLFFFSLPVHTNIWTLQVLFYFSKIEFMQRQCKIDAILS